MGTLCRGGTGGPSRGGRGGEGRGILLEEAPGLGTTGEGGEEEPNELKAGGEEGKKA